jgi:hypothetical protein
MGMVNKYKKHDGLRIFFCSRIRSLILSLFCLFCISANAFSIEAGNENFEFELKQVKNPFYDIARCFCFSPLLNLDSFHPKDFFSNASSWNFSRLGLPEDWSIFKIIAPLSYEAGKKVNIFLKPDLNDLSLSDQAFGENISTLNIFYFQNGSACFLLRSLSDDGSPASDILPTCVGIGFKWTFF